MEQSTFKPLGKHYLGIVLHVKLEFRSLDIHACDSTYIDPQEKIFPAHCHLFKSWRYFTRKVVRK
jgi:hypothetical protein